MRFSSILALLLVLDCAPVPEFERGNDEEESDTDTDVDSDVDTDTDTDADFEYVGKTYLLEVGEGNFVAPSGVGSLVDPEVLTILGHVKNIKSGNIKWLIAPTEDDGLSQNECAVTTKLEGTFTDPWFSYGPTDYHTEIMGVPATFYDFQFSGEFLSTKTVTAQIAASIDTRPLVPAVLGNDANPGDLCQLLIGFGIFCEACPNGSGPYCLPIDVQDIPGNKVTSNFVEISNPQPPCEPEDGCNHSPIGLSTMWVLGLLAFYRRNQ